MLPNPTSVSLPNRLPTDSNTLVAPRVGRTERTDTAREVLPARVTTFSSAADAQRVTPAEMDAFFEQLPVGVLLVDRDARVVYANETARALQVEKLDPLQRLIMRVLLIGDPARDDEMQVVTSGRRRWMSAHAMPVRGAESGVNAVFVTVSDMTARHKLDAWNPVIESLVNL